MNFEYCSMITFYGKIVKSMINYKKMYIENNIDNVGFFFNYGDYMN